MIDLHVDGKPGDVRRAADLMSGVIPDAIDNAGDDAARGTRTGGWGGQAGSAHASTGRDLSKGGDAIAEASRKIGTKLRALARELDDLKTFMAELAVEARDADLDVNGEAIEDPGPAGTAPSDLPPDASPDQQTEHAGLVAEHADRAKREAAYQRLFRKREKRVKEHKAWVRDELGSLPGLVDDMLDKVPGTLLKVANAGQESALRAYSESLRERGLRLQEEQVRRALDRAEETRSEREAREDRRQRRIAEANDRAAGLTDEAARKLRKALGLVDKGMPLVDLLNGTPAGKVAAEELLSALASKGGLKLLTALGLGTAPFTLPGIAFGVGGALLADQLWDLIPRDVRDKIDLDSLVDALDGDDSRGSERQDDPKEGPKDDPAPSGTVGRPGEDGFTVRRPDPDPDFSQGRPHPDKDFSPPYTVDGPRDPVSI